LWVAWWSSVFEPIAEEKFFLQPIVSEADPYYALLTEVLRISFSKALKSLEARSGGGRAPSSNMDRSCSHDRIKRRS
jgi:hypothetical protein